MVLTSSDLWFIGAALLLMAADVVAGFLTALVRHRVSSTKMREGLLHKTMLVLLIGVSAALQIAETHTGYDFGVPCIAIMCGYISVMEISSIIENVAKGYPQFKQSRLYKTLTGGADRKDTQQ